MTVLVVDGQGGGIGKSLIEAMLAAGISAEIIAAGTNSAATSAMRKAGASAAATGENAVVYNAARADIIMGGLGIIAANAMLGEISPAMAAAISGSNAVKVLLPLNRCNLRVCGASKEPLPVQIELAVAELRDAIERLQAPDA